MLRSIVTYVTSTYNHLVSVFSTAAASGFDATATPKEGATMSDDIPANVRAEIEDGPYDPSQDCCSCDFGTPCREHVSDEAFWAQMRATAIFHFSAMGIAARRAESNLFHDVLYPTDDRRCIFDDKDTFTRTHDGDGFCYRHQSFDCSR